MKETKRRKEDTESLSADDAVLYIRNLKCSTRRLLKPINIKVKLQVTNYNPEVSSFYTNHKYIEKEIREMILFIIVSTSQPTNQNWNKSYQGSRRHTQ